MKFMHLILVLFNLCFVQDRAYIFNTGAPTSLEDGYTISSQQSIADKFMVANDYVLEALVFYATMQSEQANLTISIRKDNNGLPGELVSELSTWDYSLEQGNLTGYNLIITTDLCIYLDQGNFYWFRIEASDELTEAKWVYSDASLFTYATSNDTTIWTSDVGYAGAGIIFAEQVFNPPYNQGDVNFDFIVNVIDVVSVVSHIMGSQLLDQDAIEYADTDVDGLINVVDLVSIVSIILQEQQSSPSFYAEDKNPSSEYYGENIGPSFFNGQVSCYYFGKQG